MKAQSATEYLNSKGRIIEGINGKTGEYVITPEQLDEYAEQFKPKPTTSAESKQRLFDYFAQEHDANLMSSDFVEIEKYMRPEVQRRSEEFADWLAENDWQKTYIDKKKMWHKILNGVIYTASTLKLFAKFEAERNQQQSELTCPECLSNRILEWPDKYQCRKCEHVWERSAK